MPNTLGYVYAAHNSFLPYFIKIGFTERCPYKRAEELSKSSSCPGIWEIVFIAEFSSMARKAEKIAHKHYENRNLSKEFFLISMEEFIKRFSQIQFASVDDEPYPILVSANITEIGEELLFNQSIKDAANGR